uniref:uncharacterized protein LOC120343243 n=1 Tax=Styela clava TaxID=7725 RepID=UPI0019396495|nr:uncharacterized protein LOC120343243 [Styela clava]
MKSIFVGLLIVAIIMPSLSDSSVKKTQKGKSPKKLTWRLWWRVFTLTRRVVEHARRSRRRAGIPPRLCYTGSPYPQTRCPRPGPTPRPYIDPEIVNKGSTNDEQIQYADQDGSDTGGSLDEDVFDFLEAMDQTDLQN